MMRNRRLRWFAALIALASVLFAQLAVASYACPGEMQGQANAVTGSAEGDTGCDDSSGAQRPPLCHAHCQQGDQSLDKPPLPQIGPLAAASGRIVPADDDRAAAAAPPGEQLSLLARDTAPSLAVRHCRFRI